MSRSTAKVILCCFALVILKGCDAYVPVDPHQISVRADRSYTETFILDAMSQGGWTLEDQGVNFQRYLRAEDPTIGMQLLTAFMVGDVAPQRRDEAKFTFIETIEGTKVNLIFDGQRLVSVVNPLEVLEGLKARCDKEICRSSQF